jgi:hypothetical protein
MVSTSLRLSDNGKQGKAMERGELLERGIGVHRVGDVYGDKDSDGMPIPDAEKDKWFVSVLADSPLAATVADIPLADTESEAWELAGRHYGIGKNNASMNDAEEPVVRQ